jgi:hypothetical protein
MAARLPGTRRLERGGVHSYLLDGKPCPGVTTIIGNGVPKPALVPWAAKVCAGYVVDHWDELAALTPSKRLELITKAPSTDRDAAARRGTEVHRLGERLAAGDEISVPDELVGHVDAYLRFLDDWQVEPLLLESAVVNRRWHYMGTFDLLARIAGRTWLLDLKTNRSGVFAETALQLAAYRNAEAYLDADWREHRMPAVDATAAVWVRADGYDLIPVDTGPDVFRSFLYAAQVAEFAKIGRDLIGDALVADEVMAS